MMTFPDDLAADLETVFFADYKDTATINGGDVVGHFDVTAHQWADIDSSQRIFFAPADRFPALSRGVTVTVKGVNYKYVRSMPNGGVLGIVIAMA